MASVGAIERLHAELIEVFNVALGVDLVMISDQGNWQDVEVRTMVEFAIARRDRRDFDFAQLDNGQNVPSYRLLPNDDADSPGFWVAWHENWVRAEQPAGARRQQRIFDLLGVHLAFYWGLGGNGRKRVIFRAEWDKHHEHREDRPVNAPQPHWHVDSALMVALPLREAVPETEDLEGGSIAIQDLDATRIHLGMGGWKNTARGAWHCDLVDEHELPRWVARILEHARADFGRLGQGELVPLE